MKIKQKLKGWAAVAARDLVACRQQRAEIQKCYRKRLRETDPKHYKSLMKGNNERNEKFRNKLKNAGIWAARRRRYRINSKNHKIIFIREYKRGKSCTRCPENHPACLEFHHLDPTTKKYTINKMPYKGASIKKIKEEIDKCIILCTNCHRKNHWNGKS